MEVIRRPLKITGAIPTKDGSTWYLTRAFGEQRRPESEVMAELETILAQRKATGDLTPIVLAEGA